MTKTNTPTTEKLQKKLGGPAYQELSDLFRYNRAESTQSSIEKSTQKLKSTQLKTQLDYKNEIKTTENTLRKELKEVEKNLTDKIEKTETSLNNKIEKVETSLNNKIENLESSLNNKIEKVKTSLNEKIDHLKTELQKNHIATLKWILSLFITLTTLILGTSFKFYQISIQILEKLPA